jgi:hypothetical protein
MGDNFRLNYKRKYPLDLVISEQCIDKYNSVFFFLLKLKRMNQTLSSMWKYLSSVEFRVPYPCVTPLATSRSRLLKDQESTDPSDKNAAFCVSP